MSRRAKITAIIVMLTLCSLAGAWLFMYGKNMKSSADRGPAETAEAQSGNGQEDDEPLATVFCTSDYQYEPGHEIPEETLRSILNEVNEDGVLPDAAIFCGDYTNDDTLYDYQMSPDDSIDEIKGIMKEDAPLAEEKDMIFVQGNHDALSGSISESGLHEYDDYLVYVLNTEDDFPWCQGTASGSYDKVEEASEELRTCLQDLISKGETRPVIIAGHVPLHYTARTSSRHSTGDNLYSSLMFDAVNDAGSGLDIIYLFGHDHSKGWDSYAGGGSVFMPKGERILIPAYGDGSTTDSFDEEKLAFTYMNAGYTGYYNNGESDEISEDEELTASVIEIYKNRIVITRYDADGEHALRADGRADPYKGGIDEGLIGPEYYSSRMESPAEIRRTAAN